MNEKERADLKLLENTTITLRTFNNTDDLTISKSYENVKLNDQEEFVIEFQITSNIDLIEVIINT